MTKQDRTRQNKTEQDRTRQKKMPEGKRKSRRESDRNQEGGRENGELNDSKHLISHSRPCAGREEIWSRIKGDQPYAKAA